MERHRWGDGTVFQRKDGRWQASLMTNNTKKIVYGLSENEVKHKLNTLKKEGASGTLTNPGKNTVNSLLDHLLENTDFKPKTRDDYTKISQYIRNDEISRVKLSKLTPIIIQKFYTRLQSTGNKRVPSRVHSILHRALTLAVLWQWLPHNPADRVIKPKYHAKTKRMMDTDQTQRFIEAITDHRIGPLWLLAIGSGCRLCEIQGLKWSDVDFEQQTISIQRNLQRINKQWIETTPKTEAGTRIITLADETIQALRRQKAQQASWQLRQGKNWPATDLVFTSNRGNPICPSVVQHEMAELCEKLGIPKQSPHCLRHLHASLLLGENVPLTAVSSRLGHANTGITATVYAHTLRHQDKQAAEVMHKVLKKSQ